MRNDERSHLDAVREVVAEFQSLGRLAGEIIRLRARLVEVTQERDEANGDEQFLRERLIAAEQERDKARADSHGNHCGLLYWNRRYVETAQQAEVDIAARDRERERADAAERVAADLRTDIEAKADAWREALDNLVLRGVEAPHLVKVVTAILHELRAVLDGTGEGHSNE